MLGLVAGAYLCPEYIGLLGTIPLLIGVHKIIELFLHWYREDHNDEEEIMERQLDASLAEDDLKCDWHEDIEASSSLPPSTTTTPSNCRSCNSTGCPVSQVRRERREKGAYRSCNIVCSYCALVVG